MSKYTKKDVDSSYFDGMYRGLIEGIAITLYSTRPEFANDSIDDIVKMVEDNLKIRENNSNSKNIDDFEVKND